ncbi:hypothetical protein Pla22_24430 [Rubripirellula amarantea]|uniref:Planctomycete cytochrome C n=1 Tax=Rubripirellula amarantea TaxID=2527999 RepID=A0A5C5WX18_9BACT|nr:DUF1592 domain-containing protein [Rubripirellula amarantea]TWT54789.1 hypothetical protein Pla22_24430 [Rubripirellula amarantea]
MFLFSIIHQSAKLSLAVLLPACMATKVCAQVDLPANLSGFVENHCLGCHDSLGQEGDLDLENLSFDLADKQTFATWALVHDRVDHGEMPPKDDVQPAREDLNAFLKSLSGSLIAADRKRISQEGRSKVRRVNRFEYENTLRHVLDSPWLQVSHRLPEDGTYENFNKTGDRLDVSHVQMAKYLETADYALRSAVNAAAFRSVTRRYYARDEGTMIFWMPFRKGINMEPSRAPIPLLGLTSETEVIRGTQPLTVGDSNPEARNQEAFGFVVGTQASAAKYDFRNVIVPTPGNYRLRMKTFTFTAGPNGRRGGEDHGLTGGTQKWWLPDRNVVMPGKRSEPVTLYAHTASGESIWIGTFDSYPDPKIIERDVVLRKGDAIRPDAGRLLRTQPGWRGNPNATSEGVPGFAMNWLELEGPLSESWPPQSYQALFGDLPFKVHESEERLPLPPLLTEETLIGWTERSPGIPDRRVDVLPSDPDADARRLLVAFVKNAYRSPIADDAVIEPYFEIYKEATAIGQSFTDAMISAYTTILSSPDFLFVESQVGPLEDHEIASRLSYFLWNGPPDEKLEYAQNLRQETELRAQTERMLSDPKSDRFINAFLDYWLELKEINANTPDSQLYPQYYIDDQLTEASLFETRRFFRELIDRDLPAGNLIDSDFTYANERLARHYGLEPFEGVELRRVSLPDDSPRGGLLTQASVLRVTANGTTTSPVLRGVWIMERLLGVHIPPPPSGVEAVEPDTRGATTIREQLDKHTSFESCHMCHAKFDPAGFALESFDIAGGWQERYRAIGEIGEPLEGIGLNGLFFTYRNAEPVDPSGVLQDGRAFADIQEFKSHLLSDERAIARNLVKQFIVYATGATISFSERQQVEEIIDSCQDNEYGVRSIIHAVIQSDLFKIK